MIKYNINLQRIQLTYERGDNFPPHPFKISIHYLASITYGKCCCD
jgi:hypothetical protein